MPCFEQRNDQVWGPWKQQHCFPGTLQYAHPLALSTFQVRTGKAAKLQCPLTSRTTLLDKLLNVSVCWFPRWHSLCTYCLPSAELNTRGLETARHHPCPSFPERNLPSFPVLLTSLFVSPEMWVKRSGKILSGMETGHMANSIFPFLGHWLLASRYLDAILTYTVSLGWEYSFCFPIPYLFNSYLYLKAQFKSCTLRKYLPG